MGLEDKLYKYAVNIDKIDRITGPACFALYLTGSEKLQNVANVIAMGELFVLKMPFILSYINKSKDYLASLYWIPKEIISNCYPITSVIDVFPVYKWRMQNYTRQAKSF